MLEWQVIVVRKHGRMQDQTDVRIIIIHGRCINVSKLPIRSSMKGLRHRRNTRTLDTKREKKKKEKREKREKC